ncbi:hypothetical protein [Paenibacillus sp. Soil766]|nr:hypothetical protein [Paenibacillus sp. Soil766]
MWWSSWGVGHAVCCVWRELMGVGHAASGEESVEHAMCGWEWKWRRQQ